MKLLPHIQQKCWTFKIRGGSHFELNCYIYMTATWECHANLYLGAHRHAGRPLVLTILAQVELIMESQLQKPGFWFRFSCLLNGGHS